ncbi:hypothetical protein AB1Y20_018107 [Prymnesium parvum]|uniref:SGF29 C-terminal domain-containing protein n=1 Tax=Prymnesium parvum TaxID=97485 RepID=A0AB34JPQ3_PRYPA
MPRVIPSPDTLVQKTIATLATSKPPDFEVIVSHICSSLPRDAPLPPHEHFVRLLHTTLGRLVKYEQVIQTGATFRPNPNPPSNKRGKPPPTKLVDEEEEEQQSDEHTSDDVHHEPYAGRHLGCPLRVPHDLHLGDKIAVYFADPHSEWFEGTICTINKQRTKQDNVTATFIDGEASLLLSTTNYGPENMWVLLHSASSEDASDAPSLGHPGNISLPSIAEGPARMGHSSLGTEPSKVTRPDLASMPSPSPSVNAVRHTASPPSREVAAASSKQDPADRLRALAAKHVSNSTVESPPAAVAVRPNSDVAGQNHQPPKPRPTLHHWSVCELGRFRGKVFHLDGIRNGKTIVTSVVEPANIDYEAGFITTSSGTVYRLAHTPASARKRARVAVTLPRARDTDAKAVVRRPQRDRRPTSDAWLDPWKDLTKSSYNYSKGSI